MSVAIPLASAAMANAVFALQCDENFTYAYGCDGGKINHLRGEISGNVENVVRDIEDVFGVFVRRRWVAVGDNRLGRLELGS